MEQLNEQLAIQLGKALEAKNRVSAILDEVVTEGKQLGVLEIVDNKVKFTLDKKTDGKK